MIIIFYGYIENLMYESVFFAMLKVDLLILNCSVIVVAMEKLPPLALHMQVKEETIRTNFPALYNWLPDFSLALVIIKLV